ncbi:MAG: DUF2490 domain-containing protein [Gammaproteobacteria bacterium]
MRYKPLFILGFIFYSSFTYATIGFTKFWELATFTGQYKNWTYMLEPQLRLIRQPDLYEQTLVNMGAAQTVLPNLQLWIGQTYSNFDSQNNFAEDISDNDLNEYRIWQQLLWTVPEKNLIFKARIEERHSFENAPWSIRFRERTYWTVPLINTYSFLISDEFFWNLNTVPWIVTKPFDQNRLFVGILKQINPNTSFSISYLNQYLSRTPSEINNGMVFNIYYSL